MKHFKRKRNRGLVTKRIVYLDRRHPHERPQEITADFRHSDVIDDDYAAAVVAVRTSIPLNQVKIVKIVGGDDTLTNSPSGGFNTD